MMHVRWPWLAVVVIVSGLVFAAAAVGNYYNRLPARMASHFDAQGQPDGWATKQEFVGAMAAAFGILLITMAPILLLIRYAPKSLFNLPRKDFWLAAERESETRRAIAGWLYWFTAVTVWLLALILYDSLAANFRRPPRLVSHWWLLGSYLIVVTAMLVCLIRRFRKVPRQDESEWQRAEP